MQAWLADQDGCDETNQSAVRSDFERCNAQRTATRLKYRDHRKLEQLFRFVAHYRERHRLKRGILAIDRLSNVRTGVPWSLDTNGIGMAAILRVLCVCGESCTQQNLSPRTKALCPASAMEKCDWQLLVKLRKALSHPEWDLYGHKLGALFVSEDGKGLLMEL